MYTEKVDKVAGWFLFAWLVLVLVAVVVLIGMAIDSFVGNRKAKVVDKTAELCYNMYGRLHTDDTKHTCYGAPYNGKPLVLFVKDK